jgi:hypothetical protein
LSTESRRSACAARILAVDARFRGRARSVGARPPRLACAANFCWSKSMPIALAPVFAILLASPTQHGLRPWTAKAYSPHPPGLAQGDEGPDGPHGGTWNYPTALLDDTTPGRFQFFSYDWNGDGIADAVAIKRNATGTQSTEVHILDGATHFTTFLVQTGTGLAETDSNTEFALADWDFDGIPDLFAIIKQNTGSATTEVHILSGASGFRDFILHSTSAFGTTTSQWTFKVADWDWDGVPDLIAIAKYWTGTNSTEIHIVSGASGFQEFTLHTGTPLGTTDSNWDFSVMDYDGDGSPDVIAMSKNGVGTNSTEVHVLNGSTGFNYFLVEEGTSLYMRPNDPGWQSFYLAWHQVAQMHVGEGGVMHLYASADPIFYRGGSGVLTGSNLVYFIYYGNVPANTRTILQSFVSGLGGTPYYRINTDYNAGSGYIANSLGLGGTVSIDYSASYGGRQLSDGNVSQLVNDVLITGRLPRNERGLYFVITAPDVAQTNACPANKDIVACGYHTWRNLQWPWSTDTKFGWVGDPQGCPPRNNTSCLMPKSPTPHGNVVDAMVSVLAHEISETVTDPHGNTWYETSWTITAPIKASNNENADKCAWRFGPLSTDGAGNLYNLQLSTGTFIVQQNWRLGDFGWCAMQ